MGTEKYQKKVLDLFEKSPVVSFKSIENIVNHKKRLKQYSKQLIRNLQKQKKVYRITKGFYSKYEDPALFVLCLKNSYLGIQSALSYYNLWEQETIPVIITSENIRGGLRKINEQNVLVRKVDKRYIFGFEYQKEERFYFPYSNIEKTFIDLVYFNKNKEKIDKEVLQNFKKKVNEPGLKRYLKKYPKKFQNKVLETYSLKF